MQLGFQLHARLQPALHQGIMETEGIAPVLLGLIHGRFGELERLLLVTQLAVEQADPDAGAGKHRLTLNQQGTGKLRQQGFHISLGSRCRLVMAAGQGLEQDREFVPTQTGHGVVFPQ